MGDMSEFTTTRDLLDQDVQFAITQASPQRTDDRTFLTTRTIPTMALSTASNPLTAPLLPTPTQSLQSRALSRFATPPTAVLTGGAGSLALATARALLEHSTQSIVLLDLPATLTSSSSFIQSLQSDFPDCSVHPVPCDVTSKPSVSSAFATAAALMDNRIDTLLCFAGIVGCVPSLSTTDEEWSRVLDVNLTGSQRCAREAAHYMIADSQRRIGLSQRSGVGAPDVAGIPAYSILFTSSVSAHRTNYPQPQAAYNASKAGLLSYTKSLAAELCVHGIRVNSVSPGYLDTILNAGDSLAEVRKVWAGRCPMGRMGDVEEVVGAIVMLVSIRAGRYMTGTDVVVDGGMMCF